MYIIPFGCSIILCSSKISEDIAVHTYVCIYMHHPLFWVYINTCFFLGLIFRRPPSKLQYLQGTNNYRTANVHTFKHTYVHNSLWVFHNSLLIKDFRRYCICMYIHASSSFLGLYQYMFFFGFDIQKTPSKLQYLQGTNNYRTANVHTYIHMYIIPFGCSIILCSSKISEDIAAHTYVCNSMYIHASSSFLGLHLSVHGFFSGNK